MHYQGHKIILTDERACRVCHKKIGNRSVLGVLRHRGAGDWEGIPYDGLYAGDPLKMGTFFMLQVYKRVGYLKRKGNFSFSYLKGR